jgi:hypothetical protein
MAIAMGDLKRLLQQADATESAAARLVADALIRATARQAIIAAAADAVAQLGGRTSSFDHLLGDLVTGTTAGGGRGRPGGPVDEGNPDDDDRKRSGTGPG